VSVSLKGVIAPLVTPFKADGELDRTAFERNVAAHVKVGLRGVVVAGSTGEAALLDEREREQLMDWARSHVPNDRLVIAGVGAESTRTTIRFADSAAERGADALLVVAPHYFGNAMTEAALRSHYLRVADESAAPLILYNIPKYMHFRLSDALVAELATHENIIGIKDSSGDRESFAGYLRAQRDGFDVLTGNGQFWRTALQMGARGGILAVSLFVAELTLAVAAAAERGDDAGADELQARLSPLAKTIVGELGVPGVKAAMDAAGFRGGQPRSPLMPLAPQDLERVRQLLREAAQTAGV
jgi:4-hydroxy-2-oxoglutarate aldolase